MAAASSLPANLPLHQSIERLRRVFEPELASAALQMVDLRKRGETKFSRAAEMLFTREGLEQSSSEIVSSYRARRFMARGPFTDLCCGIGGDTLALAADRSGVAVERNPAHVLCCQHNLEVYGLRDECEVIEGDALEVEIPSGVVFIDPSRRAGGRRVRSGEDYSPSLSFVLDLARKVEGLGAKLSPALRMDEDEGTADEEMDVVSFMGEPGSHSSPREIELISLDGVCREMVLWTGCFAICARRAAVLRRRSPLSFTFDAHTLQGTAQCTGRGIPPPPLDRLPRPGEFLLEPDPAVIRAHLVMDLAEQIDARQMDEQIAYLITARQPQTPFASTYRIIEAFPYGEKRLREWLVQRGVGNLTVKKRGFPLSPEQVRERLRLKGSIPATVILTRWGEGHVAVLVEGPLLQQE